MNFATFGIFVGTEILCGLDPLSFVITTILWYELNSRQGFTVFFGDKDGPKVALFWA